MTAESDDLLRHIRGFVHGRVHPRDEEMITELVARTVVLIMTNPAFYNHLTFVQELQLENWNLRQMLIAAQKPRPRKTPAKKATPTKRPAKKQASSSNIRAFKRGSSGG